MKTLKKILSLVLVALVIIPVAVLFTGCSSKSAEGKWQINEANAGEYVLTRDEYDRVYGEDDFDYASATQEEQQKANMYIRLFPLEFNLSKYGSVEVTVKLPQWVKELNEEYTESAVKEQFSGLVWRETENTVDIIPIDGVSNTTEDIYFFLVKKDKKMLGNMVSSFGWVEFTKC